VLVVSQQEYALFAKPAIAAANRKGDNNAAADFKFVTSEPNSMTSPMFSWPRISPLSLSADSRRVDAGQTRMSRSGYFDDGTSGMMDLGIGTVSTPTSPFPCQQSARISKPPITVLHN
jgi:hypothetical protein